MDGIIEFFKQADTTTKALGVTAGGLIGVFATLGFFFLIIFVADKLGGKYDGKARSKLRATVKEGANELPPFNL